MRKGGQPPWMVPDGLWARIEPVLPAVPRRADHLGRKRLDDRKVLSGSLFVLCTGIPWEFLSGNWASRQPAPDRAFSCLLVAIWDNLTGRGHFSHQYRLLAE